MKSKRWIVFGVVALVVIFLDLLTKEIVVQNISKGERISVVGDMLEWTLVYNPGAVWGINPAAHLPISETLFFFIFATIALAILVKFASSLDFKRDKPLFISLASVAGGAIGNLVDRARYGEVVDFIRVDFGFPPFDPWPIFNIADIAITCGVIVLMLDSIFVKRDGSSKLESSGEINE